MNVEDLAATSDGLACGAMGDLVAAARELKMPLATLRQLALALGEMDANDERVRAEMVGVSERAMRQVNDLLRLEKLSSGLFAMEPVAVRAACAEALQLMDDYKIKMQCRNHASLVVANRELLVSVVYHLLDSATNVAQDEVRLTVRDARGGVEIGVRDHGPALESMRPGGLSMMLVTNFAQYMRAETKMTRHRDGVSYCVWLPKSRQGCLW